MSGKQPEGKARETPAESGKLSGADHMALAKQSIARSTNSVASSTGTPILSKLNHALLSLDLGKESDVYFSTDFIHAKLAEETEEDVAKVAEGPTVEQQRDGDDAASMADPNEVSEFSEITQKQKAIIETIVNTIIPHLDERPSEAVQKHMERYAIFFARPSSRRPNATSDSEGQDSDGRKNKSLEYFKLKYSNAPNKSGSRLRPEDSEGLRGITRDFIMSNAENMHISGLVIDMITNSLPADRYQQVMKGLGTLSSRINTAALTGKFKLFTELNQQTREALLYSWFAPSANTNLHALATTCYQFTTSVFYGMATTRTGIPNPTWPALEYRGPRPPLKTSQTKKSRDDVRVLASGSTSEAENAEPSHASDITLSRNRPMEEVINGLRINAPQGKEDSSEESGATVGTKSAPRIAVSKGNVHERENASCSCETVMETEFQVIDPNNEGTALVTDAVIVGSGPAGSVVAAELAAAGKRVIIIERSSIPTGRHNKYTSENDVARDLYIHQRTLTAVDSPNIQVMAPSAFGGGMAVSWGSALQPQHFVREEYARRFGLSHFASESFRSSLETVSQRMCIVGKPRNFIASSSMPAFGKHSIGNHILIKGAEKLGYNVQYVPHIANQTHVPACDMHNQNRSKSYTWLRRAAATGWWQVTQNCTAYKVLRSDDEVSRALGVFVSTRATSALQSSQTKLSWLLVRCTLR